MSLTPQIIDALMLESLQERGQLAYVVEAVRSAALQRRLGADLSDHVGQQRDRFAIHDRVQQRMWLLLAQGLLCWGWGDTNNDQYPFYRLTAQGKAAVAAGHPQPYDPDGFIAEFKRLVPKADKVVLEYLTEGVRAFNAACFMSAAVMVGGASEQLILVLYETFEKAMADANEKKSFAKDSAGIAISRKFIALKDRLDRMVSAKKLPRDLTDTVGNELPSGFNLIRRCRNDAGHPEIPATTDPDTVFLNLRVFVEYARRVTELTIYFSKNAAEW